MVEDFPMEVDYSEGQVQLEGVDYLVEALILVEEENQIMFAVFVVFVVFVEVLLLREVY